ncbi:Tripeptidyl aminopeptidase [Penicillium rolfsii]|nr:Tripeptidyl aminopeptidase [Penicillium rolfsii]
MEDSKASGSRPLVRSGWGLRERKGASLVYILAGTLCLLWWKLPTLRNDSVPVSKLFSWDDIVPSKSLEYHDCGDGFQCTRLEVPMDYNRTNTTRGRTFALAVVRIPAKVPIDDPRYGGAMLINPGGPGGPGTLQAFLSGRNLQTIVDSENDPSIVPLNASDKYFDIIGFDPRGVGSTVPAITCFPDSMSQRYWELQVDAEGMLGSGLGSLEKNWLRTHALNSGCSVYEMTADGAPGDEVMMEYVSTTLVARDMITIIERHGEWREKQGQRAQKAYDLEHGPDVSRAILRRTQWHVGREPLLYWGRSYGTLLGATFAALYPDRVSRAVLDGVVNMDRYYEGRGPNVVIDADAIFDRFGKYCHEAGPEGCPLYAEGGSDTINDAYWAIEDQLLNSSIPVMASATRGPEVVTWTDLKSILRVAVYQPLLAFHTLAGHVSELAKGNAVPIADFKHRRHYGACPSTECRLAGPWSSQCASGQDNTLYASAAILCTDAEYMTNFTMDEFWQLWASLVDDSRTLGDYWAQVHLSCVGWKAKAKYKFTGPWGGVTAHPMLFVSNTLDPVTSLHSAKHMTEQFPGSVLLEQDSEGHTTVAAPSLCVAKAIRNYFQTGRLPESGTVCEADLKPLVGSRQPVKAQYLSCADRKLMDAVMAEVELGFLSGGPL